MHKDKNQLFGIIGLGRFGFALAQGLAESGREIVVIDSSESKIREAAALTDNAFTVSELSRDALMECGIQNCDTVIVCIAEQVDVSILTTLNVLELGVKRVIAKAVSPEQGAVLARLGAEVVYPERDMALRTAKRLTSSRIMEYISLSDTVDITELVLDEKVEGKTVGELQLRQRHGLNIIAVRKGEQIVTDIRPDMRLCCGDVVVVCGKTDGIADFEREL
ncbi:MAG: TrkA family potassium uptake protein [Oscillospiraceae bacterium]|nr:TrkA family potassium uptake protein [Oscillospiraceae bacterium]